MRDYGRLTWRDYASYYLTIWHSRRCRRARRKHGQVGGPVNGDSCGSLVMSDHGEAGFADDDQLASVGLRALHRPGDCVAADAGWRPGTMPLVLHGLEPAPRRDVPPHRYDPIRQVAVTEDGLPLLPTLEKDWTTIAGTETDGDGGDNESWTWEEA
jgi:putative ATP-grasp target RiPP